MTEAIIVLLVLARFLFGGTWAASYEPATAVFFTVDDGKTWFADDIDKIPPFDKDGKPAYRVYVYTCDGGKTCFVSHLERYTPEAKKTIETARAKGGGAEDPAIYEKIAMTGIEVKKPGTGNNGWIKLANIEAAAKITEPRCPDGTQRNLEPVVPE